SVEHLDDALRLNQSQKEALFNRAICHEQMELLDSAKDDWETYLKKDPDSPWSVDARDHLAKVIERQKTNTFNKEESWPRFWNAYDIRDQAAVWHILGLNYNRTGNYISDHLIDDYLKALANEDRESARKSIEALRYIASLSISKTGDHLFDDQ